MTRERFCELALSLGKRELIMIFTSLHFFFITRARLIKPSEMTSESLCPMLFVPQWIKIYCREGDKACYLCAIVHFEFYLLLYRNWVSEIFEKYLLNIELKLLKLAIIESPINKTLHFYELIVLYAWFLKVSNHPAFPLRGTGVIKECIS